MINKICKQCGEKFTIDDPTLEFLKKISPTFAGKKFEIPPNKFCEECRHIRRMLWRNETHLFKRKCDKCSSDLLSMYNPDSPHTVYCLECWWADDWDAKDYALKYDPSKRFLDQLQELYLKVPLPGTTVKNSVNCDYCTNSVDSKNCYMMFSGRGEDCMYGRKVVDCRDSVDTLFTSNSEKCYETVFCDKCYNSKYLHECRSCNDSMYLYDCVDCNNCFMSSNLRNKNHFFRNQQLTKEEYTKAFEKEKTGKRSNADNKYQEFVKLIQGSIHKENGNTRCENCTGDHLIECKNCVESFEVLQAENCRRFYDSMGGPSSDCMDCDHTPGSQLNYETSSCFPLWNSAFSLLVYGGKNVYYSINCFNEINSVFGSVGLKHANYAILNKVYSKEEYEKLVASIVETMIEDGDWGRFFAPELCPFAYNESIAHDYWPKKKEEALKAGFSWNDKAYGMKFSGEFYEPLEDIADYALDEKRQVDLLKAVLKCKVSGKPFRITPQELAFYIKNNIPVPNVGFFERHKERMKFRNPRQLFERKCDKCSKLMHTSYSSDRPEKVYCEGCYQNAVI